MCVHAYIISLKLNVENFTNFRQGMSSANFLGCNCISGPINSHQSNGQKCFQKGWGGDTDNLLGKWRSAFVHMKVQSTKQIQSAS